MLRVFFHNPKRQRGILLRSPQSENPLRRLIQSHERERRSSVRVVSSAIPRLRFGLRLHRSDATRKIKERQRGNAPIEYCVEESLAAHWRAACVSTRVLVV